MLRLIIVCWQDVGLFVKIILLQTLCDSVLSRAHSCFKALNYIRPNKDQFIHDYYNCLNGISQALSTRGKQKRQPNSLYISITLDIVSHSLHIYVVFDGFLFS